MNSPATYGDVSFYAFIVLTNVSFMTGHILNGFVYLAVSGILFWLRNVKAKN